MSPPDPPAPAGPIPAGFPSAFELGQMSQSITTLGREMGEVRTALDGKIGRKEFWRAYIILLTMNTAILGAIAGLAFKAFN
jgi:hypothetical protein